MTEVCLFYLTLTVIMCSLITCRFLFYRYEYILVVFSLTMTTEILVVLHSGLGRTQKKKEANCNLLSLTKHIHVITYA